MKDCANCKYRKTVALVFDLHWHNEEDCPIICDSCTTIFENTAEDPCENCKQKEKRRA